MSTTRPPGHRLSFRTSLSSADGRTRPGQAVSVIATFLLAALVGCAGNEESSQNAAFTGPPETVVEISPGLPTTEVEIGGQPQQTSVEIRVGEILSDLKQLKRPKEP